MKNLSDLNNITQFMNSYLFMIDIVFIGVMIAYLKRTWQRHNNGLAWGLTIYILGHGIIRGWTWFWKSVDVHGIQPISPDYTLGVYLFGLIVTVIGLTTIFKEIVGTWSNRFWWVAIVGITTLAYVLSYVI